MTTSTSTFGRELRMCPRRRPGIVFAIASLALGVLAAILLIGLSAEGGTTSSDLGFVAVLTAVFLSTGIVLLLLRKRTIAKRAAIRVFEHGVVHEDRTGRRRALAYADVNRLQARITQTIAARYYAIKLAAPSDRRPLTILSLWFDNVDDSLIELLAERTGRSVERL